MASTHPSEVFEEAVLDYKVDHLYALFSGGHDSLTAASLASKHELFRGVVHLNTGIGIEETREFVRDVCRSQGWPLFEQYAGLTRYEDLVLERGGFPYGAQSHNSMLFYLKQQPLRRWFATTKGRIGLVTGIRKQESVRRMGWGSAFRFDGETRNHGMYGSARSSNGQKSTVGGTWRSKSCHVTALLTFYIAPASVFAVRWHERERFTNSPAGFPM